jgi:hypothetical protein
VLASTVLATGPAGADDVPTLRLFAAQSEVSVERDGNGYVYLDPGVWITPVGGDFELRVGRADYESPITITQVDSATGATLRSLPADPLDPWSGLGGFARIVVRGGDGRLVLRQTMTFCPNSWYQQRLSDQSPLTSSYPYFCGGGYFTRGMVWGIDHGWAAGVMDPGYYGLSWPAEGRRYTVTMSITPTWVDLLGIAPEDAVAEVQVAVVRGGGGGDEPPQPVAPQAYQPYPAVPDVTHPPQGSLPDLIALPGWGMSVYEGRRNKEFLAFNATEWNEGPGTFIIEGFRAPDEPTMDAYQYFLVDGAPVGRAQIGALEFHSGGGHNHWHFQEFTEYSLLDAQRQEVLKSGKQSWCLVNTDAIDLSVPNAFWQGFGQELFTSCGGPGALWIREVLDVGWGDTYSQYVSGQAFNITGLPNGTYYVRVHVNPTGSIHEETADNNIEDRLIRIKGKPGDRRVVVPPWNGIDTEGCSFYCP